MKVRVAQPRRGDTIHGGRRYNTPECARSSEADIVRHDKQHVGRALRRRDASGPSRLRLRSLFLDHAAEFRVRRRKLLSGDRGRGAGRTCNTCDLLCHCRDATKGEETRTRKHAATDFHSKGLPRPEGTQTRLPIDKVHYQGEPGKDAPTMSSSELKSAKHNVGVRSATDSRQLRRGASD